MLKNNKIALAIAGLAIFIIIIATVFMSSSEKPIPLAINAVPLNPAFIFEIDDIPEFTEKIKNNESFYEKAQKSNLLAYFFRDINFIDSLTKNDNRIKKVLSKNKVIISGHLIGKENLALLYTIGFTNEILNNKLKSFIAENFLDSLNRQARPYDGQFINFIETEQTKMYYSFCNDYFLLSSSETVIERAVRQATKGVSISSNIEFQNIYQTLSSSSDATLYINYEVFSKAVAGVLDKKAKNKVLFLKNFGIWSALDIKLGYDNIQITGFTSQESKYLQIFSKQSLPDNDIIDVFPKKTASFIILGMENGKVFEKKYFDFLASTKTANNYQGNLKIFYDKFKINYKKNNMYKFTGSSLAYLIEDVNKNGKNYNNFAYLKITDFDKAKKFMDKISIESTEKIKSLKDSTFLKLHFGEVFSGIKEKYYMFTDDYIIFSDKDNSLKTLSATLRKGDLFKSKVKNRELLYLISEESAFLAYTDISHLENIIIPNVKKEYAKNISNDMYFFRYLKGPVFQFISGEKVAYSSIQFNFSGRVNSKETVWECELDTTVSNRPQIVLNHINKEKEVLVQDDNNKIYLINKNGEIVWRRQISDKIIGDVKQIDYYKNFKLQYLFNTKKHIHLMDRKGNYVEGYPIRLSSPATNSVSVFDYDNDKDYRILIATQDMRVRLFDKKGKLLEGWKFNKTADIVTDNIQYFKNDGKDYIVFTDKRTVYILNRKGERRVIPKHEFDVGENSSFFLEKASKNIKARLVTTNNIGQPVFIYLADGNVTKINIKNYSPKHYFYYRDITGDKIPEFIFADKNNLEIFNRNKEEITSYSCESESVIIPSIYKFSDKNIQIGLLSEYEGEIFMINKEEELFPGFPLRGKTEFRITRFSENEGFSVVVGSSDNFLYKYMLN